MTETRKCPRCKEELPIAHFGKNRRNKNGVQTYCKTCTVIKVKESQERHKERYNKYQREYHQNLRDENLERARNFRRRRYVRAKYGITLGVYNELMGQPRCDICSAEFSQVGKPHLDHCHTSGVIRGVLCSSCNIGLGHFKDDPVNLQLAAKYLNSERVF